MVGKLMLGLMFGLLSMESYGDLIVKFSSCGIDRYADGTAVRDGECYALVWMREGTDFKGFQLDASLVDPTNNAMLIAAPVAKGGHCPPVLYQYDASLEQPCTNGFLRVCLLDTRRLDGRPAGVTETGALTQVRGWGLVESADIKCTDVQTVGAGSLLSSPCPASASQSGVMPAHAPRPHIKSIVPMGDKVYLTVEGTVGYLRYGATVGGTPATSQTEKPVEESVKDGRTGEMLLILPKRGSNEFFKVKGF